MAQLNGEQLDDPLLFDTCPDFSGGMASNRSPSALTPTQFYLGENVDIKTKLAVTRRGTMTLGAVPNAPTQIQGMQWFDTPSTKYLIAAAGGQLWKYNEVSWTSLNAYTSAGPSTAQIGMTQLIDTIYIADASTNVFSWDGTTLTDLGSDPTASPPKGNLIINSGDRLWIAGNPTTPDMLTASTALATTWNNGMMSVRIGLGEGDPIVAIAPWDNNQVVVLKRNSIFIISADPIAQADDLSGSSITQVTTTIGCVAARSVQIVGSDVWFLSDFGLRSVRRVLAQTQREVSQDLSEPVHDIIQRINWPVANQCASFYWDNKYMISLPLDDAILPSSMLVFDTLQQAFAGIWTGWTPLCFVLSKANLLQRLNFGQPDGTVSRWLDYVPIEQETLTTYQDNGADIPTTLQGRGMIFGDGTANTSNAGLVFVDGQATKSPFSCEVTFYQSEALADLNLSFDEGEPSLVASAFVTQGGIPLVLPFNLPATIGSNAVKRRIFPTRQFNAFREMQIAVSSTRNKLAVRGASAACFGDTVLPELT